MFLPLYSFLKRIKRFSIFFPWKTQKWFSVYGIVSWVFSQLFFAEEWQILRPTGPCCSFTETFKGSLTLVTGWACWSLAAVLSLSRVRHFVTPMEPARLFCPCGSSRQEYWSGLLCPLLAIFRTHVSRTAGGFFTTWATRESPRMLEWAACPFSKGSSWPRNWTRSPAFQADSLPPEPPGKPH